MKNAGFVRCTEGFADGFDPLADKSGRPRLAVRTRAIFERVTERTAFDLRQDHEGVRAQFAGDRSDFSDVGVDDRRHGIARNRVRRARLDRERLANCGRFDEFGAKNLEHHRAVTALARYEKRGYVRGANESLDRIFGCENFTGLQ
jgi:hypothetical protein